MASKEAISRLRKEFSRLQKNPAEHITAVPLDSNILEWHYVINGPKDSVYAGGVYHGKVIFPPQYPYKPPAILMITPNGRFKTDTRLCLSMSDFHPESWNPMWSVQSILQGLLSFMLETTPTLGSEESSDATKRVYASQSLAFNRKSPIFRRLFPQFIQAKGGDVEEEDENTSQEGLHKRAAVASGASSLPAVATIAAGHAAEVAAAPDVRFDPAPPAVLEYFGGRLKIKEDSLYDVLAIALAFCTLVFVAFYLANNK